MTRAFAKFLGVLDFVGRAQALLSTVLLGFFDGMFL